MNDDAQRIAAAEDLIRRFSGALKAVQLYSPEHPIVGRGMDLLAEHLENMLTGSADVVVGVIDRQIVVDDIPLANGPGTSDTADRFRNVGIERVQVERGASRDELGAFLRRLAAFHPTPGVDDEAALDALGSAHIRVGRIRLQNRPARWAVPTRMPLSRWSKAWQARSDRTVAPWWRSRQWPGTTTTRSRTW
jgi:hypothetical protein